MFSDESASMREMDYQHMESDETNFNVEWTKRQWAEYKQLCEVRTAMANSLDDAKSSDADWPVAWDNYKQLCEICYNFFRWNLQ